jgi:hypothetical protein
MDAEDTTDRLNGKPSSYKRRVAELFVGLATKDLTDRAFDYLLYPFVIYKLGILKGGIVMTLLAAVANILTLKFYDWSKRDWLGVEAIKGMKNYQGTSRIARLFSWMVKKGDIVAMLFLSIKEDAFIAVIYMRHGSHQYNGMSRRDWKIFLTSLIIANIYWTLAAYMGISVVEWVWKRVIL